MYTMYTYVYNMSTELFREGVRYSFLKIICLKLLAVLETDLNTSVCISKLFYLLIFNFFKLQSKKFLKRIIELCSYTLIP